MQRRKKDCKQADVLYQVQVCSGDEKKGETRDERGREKTRLAQTGVTNLRTQVCTAST